MSRIIFHVDVNSAFLSWSAVKRLQEDPQSVDLRTIPSAVGGDVETRHGIITAKSIPAKKYGIVTGEPVVKALQKCPNLVLVSSDWEAYRAYSKAFMEILHEYSDVVQQASVDEAYVDMTDAVTEAISAAETTAKRGNGIEKTKALHSHEFTAQPETILSENTLYREYATKLAASIRKEVRTRLGFTVNVGISSNKLLAKMASDFQKPDRTHTLWPEEIAAKMWPLPIGSLYGCGSKTASRLTGIGIATIGDAARADVDILQSFLGEKGGLYVSEAAKGHGSDHVAVSREEAQSYSNETTTAEDITLQNYESIALPLIRHLSEKVAKRLQKDGVYGATVTVSVKTNDFRRRSRQKKLESSTNDANLIRRSAEELLHGLLYERNGIFDQDIGVRLIGVGVSSLDHGEYRQMDFESFLQEQETEKKEKKEKERQIRLDSMLNQVKSRYGDGSLHRGI